MTSPRGVLELTVSTGLASDVAAQVRGIAKAAADDLTHAAPKTRSGSGSGKVAHVVATRDGDVVGYAHSRATEDGPLSAHVVVAPTARRGGVGTALVTRLVELAGPRGLRVWAHGDDAAADDHRPAKPLVGCGSTPLRSPTTPSRGQ